MKVNATEAGSVFEKMFSSYPSNSKKKSSTPDRFKKSFSFSIYSPYFKNADEILGFCISKGSNSVWHVLQGAVNIYNFVSGANLSE